MVGRCGESLGHDEAKVRVKAKARARLGMGGRIAWRRKERMEVTMTMVVMW